MLKAQDRQEAEAIVAAEFGVQAPFPPVRHIDRFLVWLNYRDHRESETEFLQLGRSLGDSASKLKRGEAEIARIQRAMDRLKVPSPYVSWAHIAAFWRACDNPIGEPDALAEAATAGRSRCR